MDEREFRGHIAGAVEWAYNGEYCYFLPNQLPLGFEIDESLESLLLDTVYDIGRLGGKMAQVPDSEIRLLIRPFLLKESVQSSAIEGTRTTVADIYREERGISERTRHLDNLEVRNYIEALEHGLQLLSEQHILQETDLLSMHRILLDGVRGQGESPGRYRDIPVAIGSQADTLETAAFVPPPPTRIARLMENLLEYVNSPASNKLLKIAIAHYQFETVHPFADGNGRMGRLLIMLNLCQEGMLPSPVLYPSEYFNKNRSEYIRHLYEVSSEDDFNGWFVFFLKAMGAQVSSSINLIDDLERYRQRLYGLAEMEGDIKLKTVADLLFENPYIRSKDIVERLGVSSPTANKLIGTLVRHSILTNTEEKTRGRVYVANDIMGMLER